ncbi:hypothetical protein FHL15_005400 [Xylaria flabelliformis]|uniref:Nephrocystin 3-like N-terminal domain-containing protein n=1 Tax=Xylaria flabelliformis TaxID=2512241 RepID=A0A553I0J3_9PEZI|nr:hypothetical protein FHL15_005400 [Xylaria flabelliformis]
MPDVADLQPVADDLIRSSVIRGVKPEPPFASTIWTSDASTFYQLDAKCQEFITRYLGRSLINPDDPNMGEVNRKLLRLAFNHPFLMHASLAVALAYDRYQNSSLGNRRTLEECYHCSRSTILFNRRLREPIETKDKDAIWGTAAALAILSFSSPDVCAMEEAWPLKSSNYSDLEWLRMIKGKMSLWRIINPLRSDSIFRVMASTFAHMHSPLPEKGRDGIPRALAIVCHLDDLSTAENNPYFNAVHAIAQIQSLSDSQVTTGHTQLFTRSMQGPFECLLKDKDPISLLLLYLWYRKAGRSIWFIELRARVECPSICSYLRLYHKEYNVIHDFLPGGSLVDNWITIAPICKGFSGSRTQHDDIMSRGLFAIPWTKAFESRKPTNGQAEWGMHILVNKDADSAEAIDIVAIHGINGHWDNTWKDKSTGTNWLQDSIPKQLKAARVMSFSYNSSVQFSKSVSRVAEFADQLLESLMAKRVNGAEQDRPILFICHSLGGIVFKQVVDRDSAVLGIEEEIQVAIDGNHRSMCRFTSSDTRLPVVLTNIVQMAKRWKLILDQRVSEGMLFDRLRVSNHLLHKDRNPSPIQGTCSWVLSHPEFRRWHESTGPSLMWLSANPGCGKSVMMSFLIDHFQSNVVSKDAHICYWFFKSDNQEQKSAVFALRGMLRQLLEARRSVIHIVQEAAKDKDFDKLQDIWKLLVQATRGRPPTKDGDRNDVIPVRHTTICLIDGLDECEAGANRELIWLIQTYFQELEQLGSGAKTSERKLGFMKVLIASRPENWIKAALDRLNPRVAIAGQQQRKCYKSATQCCTIRLKAEDESGLISDDIALVVRAAITDLVNQGFPELLLHDIQERLIARADRIFIWITLIIDLLRDKVEAGASRRELDDILKSRTVDQIFTEFLRGRLDAPKTRKLFNILLAAARPLTVEELSIALALTPEYSALSNSHKPFRPKWQNPKRLEYDLVYPFENHIRSLGGHFIRIIRNEVYFVHETAREFLLENNSSGFYPFTGEETAPTFDDLSVVRGPNRCSWQHSFPKKSCHALLLDLCATYLYMVGQAILREDTLVDHHSIFINYVSKAWLVHFGVVIAHIDSLNLPYYHNLCHPKFPGFSSWTKVYWTNWTEINPTVGMVDDEIQDYYLETLNQNKRRLISESDDDYGNYWDASSDETEGFKTMIHKEIKPTGRGIPIPGHESSGFTLREELIAQIQQTPLSVNPTARPNHNFPLSVDKYGFVSVDYNISNRHSS